MVSDNEVANEAPVETYRMMSRASRLQAFFNEARSFHGLWLVFSVVAACLVFRIRGRGLLAECRYSGEFTKFFL